MAIKFPFYYMHVHMNIVNDRKFVCATIINEKHINKIEEKKGFGHDFFFKKNGKKSKKVQRANLICQTIFTQMVCDIEIEGNCVNKQKRKQLWKTFLKKILNSNHKWNNNNKKTGSGFLVFLLQYSSYMIIIKLNTAATKKSDNDWQQQQQGWPIEWIFSILFHHHFYVSGVYWRL